MVGILVADALGDIQEGRTVAIVVVIDKDIHDQGEVLSTNQILGGNLQTVGVGIVLVCVVQLQSIALAVLDEGSAGVVQSGVVAVDGGVSQILLVEGVVSDGIGIVLEGSIVKQQLVVDLDTLDVAVKSGVIKDMAAADGDGSSFLCSDLRQADLSVAVCSLNAVQIDSGVAVCCTGDGHNGPVVLNAVSVLGGNSNFLFVCVGFGGSHTQTDVAVELVDHCEVAVAALLTCGQNGGSVLGRIGTKLQLQGEVALNTCENFVGDLNGIGLGVLQGIAVSIGVVQQQGAVFDGGHIAGFTEDDGSVLAADGVRDLAISSQSAEVIRRDQAVFGFIRADHQQTVAEATEYHGEGQHEGEESF